MKFKWNCQEVIIHRDGSNPVYTSQTIPTIGYRRRPGGETYHHIERVNAIEKDKWWSNKIESILAWSGYEPDKGLVKNLQVNVTCIEATQHENSDSDKEDEIPEEIVREVENFENKPKSNLDETEAIQELQPRRSKRDVMSFLGSLNYISHFIAQSIVICEPIFKILRKDASWTEDCQKAFDKIKEYMFIPPVLVPPEPGQPLLLYLSVLDGAFGCALGKHDETGRKEQALYYLSKKFTPYEARFPCTNNIAEYEACILGLNMVVDMNIQELLVIDDSDFLVHQVHADMIIVPPNKLNATSSPWPFTAWGMDFIGLIEPTASNRHSVLESIVTDNVANLNSDLMKAMCETFKIKHKNSTAYIPQMNGAVEPANKKIKKILRKMVENHKQWHEKLPFALLGYRTMIRTSIRATPYMLVYGTEAAIPVGVEIPYLRVIQETELCDAKWTRSHYEQLALIDRKRMNVVCHVQLYQNRMSRAFNKRIKPRRFAPGQLVLKRIFPHQDEAKGKLSPNWQGSYMVHRVLIGGALILAEMDGEI
ncbi:uncharacterized protein [Nicotiana sylvestris]|uniref:uncharacterized protein n=1 Tax=Nicotiana sylvestris TaxID=4096 RepID=UPI00388C7C8F